MIINTNLPAMSALRHLNAAQSAVSNSMQKLSSGKRINSAADDAAGLAITQTMESQIEGLNQASRNSQDAISLMQTGEGALNETQSILQRMRDLSVEASSDTYTANDRKEIQSEMDQLKQEVDQIGNTTTFNGKNLLDGSAAAITSSDKANTQVMVRGAMSTASGSFKLSISSTAGQAQIQKTNVFKITSGEVINNLTIASGSGVNSAVSTGLQIGDYKVDNTIGGTRATAAGLSAVTAGAGVTSIAGTNVDSLQAATTSTYNLVATVGTAKAADNSSATAGALYVQNAAAPSSIFGGGVLTLNSNTNKVNMSILAQVTNVSADGKNVTYQFDYHDMSEAGVASNGTQSTTVNVNDGVTTFNIDGVAFKLGSAAADNSKLTVGDKQVFTVAGSVNTTTATYDTLQVQNATNSTTPLSLVVNHAALDGASAKAINFYALDAATGKSYDSSIALTDTNLAAGTSSFTATRDNGAVTAGTLYAQNTTTAPKDVFGGGNLTVDAATKKNMSILAQVTNINNNLVTYQVSYHGLDNTGAKTDGSQLVTIDLSKNATDTANKFSIDGVNFQLNNVTDSSKLTVGDKQVFDVTASSNYTGSTGTYDTVSMKYNGGSGSSFTSQAVVNVDNGALNNKTTDFDYYTLNATTGQSYDGTTTINAGGLTTKGGTNASTDPDAVTFTAADGAGQVASANTLLSNIDKFTDANGKFLLEQPQSLTLVEGDGKQATVQLYASDTMQNVVDKLNKAIGTGLGQSDLLANAADANKFASFVSTASTTGGSESTQGTVVIRSSMAGQEGQINVVGDEALLNALGLSDMQKATESKFTVSVTDANNPSNIIASNVSIQGNTLVGVVDQNVDVKFASNANINSTYNTTTKQFDLTQGATPYTTTVNLVNNTQTFQIGANESQNMTAAIGDMRTAALGIDNVLVTDKVSASKATSIIDSAIARVSAQRSQLGALQNRLTHTINNLGVAGQNLSASQSNIQDVDMAQEMTSYAKEGILTTSANSMLAQANNKNTQLIQQLLQG